MTPSPPTRPAAGGFDAAVAWHGRIVSVTVAGALDIYSAPEARSLLLDLLEREPSRLLIDAHAAFVDSSGIGVLVHAAQRARQERRDFRLTCHERLSGILRLHGLDEVLGVEKTDVAEASQESSQGRRLAA
jgi:anti-sigma B factor antagonist